MNSEQKQLIATLQEMVQETETRHQKTVHATPHAWDSARDKAVIYLTFATSFRDGRDPFGRSATVVLPTANTTPKFKARESTKQALQLRDQYRRYSYDATTY